MRTRYLVAVLVVAAVGSGCSREATPEGGASILTRAPEGDASVLTRAVHGDVFIVTKGGPSIKLGLVEVRLVPEASVDAKLPSVIGEAQSKHRSLREDVKALTAVARLNEIGAGLDVRGHWDDLLERARSLDNPAFLARVKAQRADYLKERKKGLEEQKAHLERLEQRQIQLLTYSSGYALVPSLPPSQFTARTDADGRFTMSVPRGRYVAIASTKRDAGSQPEFYAWAVRVDLEKQPDQKLMLSNDNLVEASCDQCALRTADIVAPMKADAKQAPRQ